MVNDSPTASTTTPTLSVRHATKRFGGSIALSDVDLDLWPGEAHALVGENGAGKSTLIKLITGVYLPDGGEVLHRGEVVHFPTPRAAQLHGIQTIYQEVNLAPQLSIARNMFLGREPTRAGWMDLRRMNREAGQLLGRYGITADVKRPLGELSLGVQQMVAVVRAVSTDASVVIMDEPTSSLEPREVDKLLDVVGLLKAQGVSVVYVSHKLEEVFRVCDKITVLRDGRLVWTGAVGDTTRRQLISRMLGRDPGELGNGVTHLGRNNVERGESPVLAAHHLKRRFVLDDISLVLHPGEIVGLAGLLGSGRSETAKAIFGALAIDSGTVEFCGRRFHRSTPGSRLRAGVAMLPEDRKVEGLIPELSIRDNIGLAALPMLSKRGFVSRRKQAEIVDTFITRLRIKASGPEQKVSELSGGNQQKVLLARMLCLHPRVLLLDEPTRGIDVGAKAEVQALISDLASKGLGVILISSELEEIVEGSDTVLVLRDGAALGTLFGEEINESAIMTMIAGAAEMSTAEQSGEELIA